ncbi:MAG: hypothetical protein AAB526_03200 [Patescibacteria group bacterium]
MESIFNESQFFNAKDEKLVFELIKYNDEEKLNKAHDLLQKKVEESPAYYQIIYHSFKHWNELLEFSDKTIPNILKDKNPEFQKEILILSRLAAYFHDIGYYIPDNGKFTAKNHEERSKNFVEEKSQELGLTEKQKKSLQFIIEFTKFKIGENFTEEIKKVNQAIKELEEKNLSSESKEYLKFLEENNKIDLDFASAILLTAKTIAIADVYGHSKDYISLIPGLWQELILEESSLAKSTIIEQIAASIDFLNFAEQQRLKNLLNGEYSISSYIPQELINQREKNLNYLKKFKKYFEKIKQEKCSAEDKEKFKALLSPFLNNKLWKEIIKKEIKKILNFK